MDQPDRLSAKKTTGQRARVFQAFLSIQSSTFIPSLREVRLFVAQSLGGLSGTNTIVKNINRTETRAATLTIRAARRKYARVYARSLSAVAERRNPW